MKIDFDKSKTLCLTGHRPKGLPWGYNENDAKCILFKNSCKKIFVSAIEFGITNFITGMAQGFDMLGTELLIELKKVYKHIKIVAVIPCKNQEIKWNETYKIRYRNILKHCDKQIILNETYTPTCMNDRNKFMVDNSAYCIACYNGKPSGTKNTILYAKKTGVKVKILNPNEINSTY